MAHNVSNEYKQIIYSGDARNKLKILFNNVELQDADRYCERLTIKSRIVPNGAKIFNLNNFISKEADLILHDIDTNIIQDQVSISIGTLVGNSYEYVPIGIFNIQDTPTNDKRKTTIKLRDNSVKFDFNYNAQPLIEQNGGVATKLQILQDICSQAGVTCNITSFIGYLDEIGVYDNTITAREYISRIAEQAGKIATINRSGELIFVDLNNLTTWEIPIEVVEKYENGTNFKIGRVVYEDGIIRYETPTSNDDTLFLDGSNNYINGELVKEQASSNDNTYYLQDSGDSELAYLEIEGKTTQETRSGKNLLNVSNTTTTTNGMTFTIGKDNSITLNGTTTANTFYNLNYAQQYFVNFKNGKSYTMSVDKALPHGISITTRITNPNQNLMTISYNAKEAHYTANADYSTFTYLYIPNGYTFNNYKLYIQIEEGTQATSYEQYGVSPSPDYPSELVSVGYENLFDINSVIMGDYTGQNATIRATTRQVLYLKKGSYTLKTDMNLSTYGIALAILPNVPPSSSYNALQDFGYITNQTTTFNVTSEGYAVFTFRKNGNLTFTLDEIKQFNYIFIKGTQSHSYIPYGKYGIEVKTTGKNLFNLTRRGTTTTSGITFTINEDKTITVSGTYSSIVYFNLHDGKLPIQPNTTYTLSGMVSQGQRLRIRLFDSNNNEISSNAVGSNYTFTTPSNAVSYDLYIVLYALPSSVVYKPQLEKNSQATTYETYKSNTYLYTLDNPLRSIGNIKDLLYINNGMLYVDRKIGNKIFNGNENGWYMTTDGNYKRFSIQLTNIGSYNVRKSDLLSDYFKPTTTSGYGIVYYYDKYLYFYPNNNITTLEAFKSWLSTHNTEVQYILAEPYTEAIGEIEVPNTYNDITYIDILSNIDTNSYLQYRQSKTQLEAILQNTNQFSIDSLKTGKILGNPAIDSYDLIQIHDTYKNETYTTLATSDLVYTGVLINTFDTQIGEEAKEQNVFINGEDTFKKWARTTIDNVEGSISLQAGEIDTANGRINETNLRIDKDGALLNVLANNSNIDVQYDSAGNPLSGEVREVTTTTGFTFNAEGMTIEDTSSNFKALHRNTGTYYYDGDTITGQYTKDGSKQKDLELFGVYYYGKNDFPDTPMFVAELYTDENGEECFGHFFNRGD